jgi:phosphonate transport system substrate-binding protein
LPYRTRATLPPAFRLAFAFQLALVTAIAQSGAPLKPIRATAPTGQHAFLRWVASRNVFNNVNRDDARAALQMSSEILAQQKGYVVDTTVDIVASMAEIRERLRNHTVELITLGTPDYLELENAKLLVPVLTDVRTSQGGPLYAYVLLVGPSSAASSVAGLRGKKVLVSARGSGLAGSAWLEILLAKQKLEGAASFFGSVKLVAKPQACMLPLFFGIVDACVVDEVNLNLAKEMNPQLGRLRVLSRSPPLIESVVAVPAEPHPLQKELIEAMLSLHADPRGRQLLMVFKTDRLVPIQPGDLDSAREFWRDFWRLSAAPPNR